MSEQLLEDVLEQPTQPPLMETIRRRIGNLRLPVVKRAAEAPRPAEHFTAIVGDSQYGATFRGEGATKHEALEACIQQLKQEVHFDRITLGIQIPEDVNIPENVPPGCGLFVLERVAHSSGDAYEWRICAIPFGDYWLDGMTLRRTKPMEEKDDAYVFDPAQYRIRPNQAGKESFLDCNGDYAYRLPNGSKEFVGGRWVWRKRAEYNY